MRFIPSPRCLVQPVCLHSASQFHRLKYCILGLPISPSSLHKVCCWRTGTTVGSVPFDAAKPAAHPAFESSQFNSWIILDSCSQCKLALLVSNQ